MHCVDHDVFLALYSGDGTVKEFLEGVTRRANWYSTLCRTPLCSVSSGTANALALGLRTACPLTAAYCIVKVGLCVPSDPSCLRFCTVTGVTAFALLLFRCCEWCVLCVGLNVGDCLLVDSSHDMTVCLSILLQHIVRPVDAILVVPPSRDRVLLSVCGTGWGVPGDIAAESESCRGFRTSRYCLLKVCVFPTSIFPIVPPFSAIPYLPLLFSYSFPSPSLLPLLPPPPPLPFLLLISSNLSRS